MFVVKSGTSERAAKEVAALFLRNMDQPQTPADVLAADNEAGRKPLLSLP